MDETVVFTREPDPFAERADALIRLSEQLKTVKDATVRRKLLRLMDTIASSLEPEKPAATLSLISEYKGGKL